MTSVSTAYAKVRALAGSAFLAWLWSVGQIAKRVGLHGAYYRFVAWQIRCTGLFDDEYYLEANPDVAEAGIDPLMHFLRAGQREGRNPTPLFETRYYRSRTPGKLKFVNTTLHYWQVGRFEDRQPCQWFDPVHYRAEHPKGQLIRYNGLRHFLEFGKEDGISPSADFDLAFYLHAYPDVARSNINPLVHYLRTGFHEGRVALPNQLNQGNELPSLELSMAFTADWHDTQSSSQTLQARVDVIVPVYAGLNETLRCLHSVLDSPCQTPFELIVINDASPDPELTARLQDLADQGHFTLLHNSINHGFVYTANRGLGLHLDRDVILLNADTEVFGNWIDRLLETARWQPYAGTITPLSNNATICSYPRFNHDNPAPLEIGYADLDQLCATVNSGQAVEAPTGVGFCMYMRRACISDVGNFDEAAFGRGYGEENDFCQRAQQKGWKNLIAADVFVHHLGSTSFKGERSARVKAALAVLNARHPQYQRRVQAFCTADPLLPHRQALDMARLQTTCRERNVLIISHDRGGGTLRHIEEDTRRLTSEGYGVFYLRPLKGQPGNVRIKHPLVGNTVNLPSYRFADTQGLADVLRELRITDIHTHGLVDFESAAPTQLRALASTLGARVEINLHDYKVICPRVNLVDQSGLYCGEPDTDRCNRCLRAKPNEFGAHDITQWRHEHEQSLREADAVTVPHADVAQRIQRYFPGLHVDVDPHEDLRPTASDFPLPTLSPEDPLRIVVIGAIGPIKGFGVLHRCAQQALEQRLPLQFILMGYGANNDKLAAAGVKVLGRYRDEHASKILQDVGAHVAWLPSVWPETYSYTLSLALSSHLRTFAFDLGAIGARLREAGLSDCLIPLDEVQQPKRINARLLAFRQQCLLP